MTHPVKFTSELSKIIPSINYNNVNFAYLRAILHNVILNILIDRFDSEFQEFAASSPRTMQKTYQNYQIAQLGVYI